MYANSNAAYRAAAAEGASVIGLTILVYDALARDLFLAAESCSSADVAERCRALKHALELIGHLESWAEGAGGGSLPESLRGFYGLLRGRMLALQAAPEAAAFQQLADLVSETRQTWQRKEHLLLQQAAAAAAAETFPIRSHLAELEVEAQHGSWSV